MKNHFTARVKTNVPGLPREKIEETVNEVYEVLLSKMFHARSNVTFSRWKEKRIKTKDKFAFRSGLKANESSKSSKKTPAKAKSKSSKKQLSKAKEKSLEEVTDKKSASSYVKSPVKVTPDQHKLLESASIEQPCKRRKSEPIKEDDDSPDAKELTMGTVNLM